MIHVSNAAKAFTTVYGVDKVLTDFMPFPLKYYSTGYSPFGSSNLPVLEALHMLLLHLTITFTFLTHTHSLVIAQMLLLESKTPSIKQVLSKFLLFTQSTSVFLLMMLSIIHDLFNVYLLYQTMLHGNRYCFVYNGAISTYESERNLVGPQ